MSPEEIVVPMRDFAGTAMPALILHPSGTRRTYDDLDEGANRLAHYLRRRGLTPGDTLAVLMENDEHVHTVMWAARRSGLYFAMINPQLTVAEIAYVLIDSGATAIISSATTQSVCRGLRDHVSDRFPAVALIADDEFDGWQRYPECVAGEPTTPVDDECDGQLLQYSAGSTGRPKGIRRPMSMAAKGPTPLSTPVFEAVGVSADSVYLSPAPIHHTAPSMWTMAAQEVGATTVMMERFDAEQALSCIERHRVTHAQFVPTMFVRMLRLPESTRRRYDLSSLQRVVHAAAPCPPTIKRQMIEWWGPIIDEYYGSSEGAGISFIRAEDWLHRPGSVGRMLLGRPHILDVEGREVGAGEIGDVYCEGGYPFEYLNDPAQTAAGRNERCWVSVGDVGYLDDDGYLFLTDRRHHVIISGGVNVYPQEAENVLIDHPMVIDAAVFGVPDEDRGQRVTAAVQLVDHATGSEELASELMEWVHRHLARYKCPRSISFEARLPRTDAGKLLKDRLVAKYSGGVGSA